MKKIVCGATLLVIVAVLCLLIAPTVATANTEQYLRIHIRANSNKEVDQGVKLKVKDAVVEALIPLLSSAQSKQEAIDVLQQNTALVSDVAAKTLRKEGFAYGARAMVKQEEFPVRSYAGLTLAEGNYDALVVELGEGTGDNWWCVAFPPLCFVPNGGKNIVYKSKIMEIIQSWKNANTSD